jgi:hypothetical protein
VKCKVTTDTEELFDEKEINEDVVEQVAPVDEREVDSDEFAQMQESFIGGVLEDTHEIIKTGAADTEGPRERNSVLWKGSMR